MNLHLKTLASTFQELVITGNIDEAYETFVDMNGKHHNPFFAAGFAALKEGIKQNHLQFPNKVYNIQHITCEDDLVTIHSHIILKDGVPGVSAFHLFRFKNNKIVEMWDCGQSLPKDQVNSDGAF